MLAEFKHERKKNLVVFTKLISNQLTRELTIDCPEVMWRLNWMWDSLREPMLNKPRTVFENLSTLYADAILSVTSERQRVKKL